MQPGMGDLLCLSASSPSSGFVSERGAQGGLVICLEVFELLSDWCACGLRYVGVRTNTHAHVHAHILTQTHTRGCMCSHLKVLRRLFLSLVFILFMSIYSLYYFCSSPSVFINSTLLHIPYLEISIV